MNTKDITKQALDFQKDTFDCWWDAMSIIQDQAALAVDRMLNQTKWIPDEGRQAVSGLVGTCKNERDRYKGYMKESFSVLEKHLAQATKDAPAGPDEPAAEAKTATPAIKSKAADVEEKKSPATQETKQSNQ